ncbi:hypothetical protein CNY89_30400, partial [Amaricoccus sp. HAR-UPW-R2A-40]
LLRLTRLREPKSEKAASPPLCSERFAIRSGVSGRRRAQPAVDVAKRGDRIGRQILVAHEDPLGMVAPQL